MRWALVLVVALFSLFFINKQFSDTSEVNLEPPFDAAQMQHGKKNSAKVGERVIFIPNDDGQLRRVVVKDPPGHASTNDTEMAYSIDAAYVVKQLLKEAPAEFPANTSLLGVKVDPAKKIASINLSKDFAAPGFWQGSTRTLSTVYAVVNTVAAVHPRTANKVQILVNGKPVDVLGEFDASEPLEPDNKLVASR